MSRKKNIHVITFNINLEPFLNSLVTKEQARLDLDIPLNKKMIGILGRPGSGKNQDFLIRAVNFLKLNNYTLDLLIMGEPKSQEEKVYSGFLRELMCECNLQDRIHFRTFSEDKISFFRTIDIFVNTITGETCDITMIESMAAGVPVISVQSDYNSEILEDGTLGILYKENDLEDFSAKIIKVLNQNKLYTYLQKEGIRTAGEKYNLKSKSSEFNEFIYGVLNFK